MAFEFLSLLSPSDSSSCAPSILTRKKMDPGICPSQVLSQKYHSKPFEVCDDFACADFQILWSQRLLESSRLNVSNVIWATRLCKGSCGKLALCTNMYTNLGPAKTGNKGTSTFGRPTAMVHQISLNCDLFLKAISWSFISYTSMRFQAFTLKV